MTYIIILGLFQAILALVLLSTYNTKERQPAYTLLKGLLVCLMVHLAIKFSIYVLQSNENIKSGFNTFLDLAYGPLLWLYCQKIQNNNISLRKQWYLFLPSIVCGIFYVIIAIDIWLKNDNYIQWIKVYNHITGYLIMFSFTFYAFKSLLKASDIPLFWKQEMILIKRVALIFLSIGLICISFNLISLLNIGTIHLDSTIRVLVYSGLLFVSILIFYYRFKTHQELNIVLPENISEIPKESHIAELQLPRPDFKETILSDNQEHLIDSGFSETQELYKSPILEKSRIVDITFSDAQFEDIVKKLTFQMEQKKVFTDPQLSLDKLAHLINEPRNDISRTLNNYLNKSFYQFVNEYRIEEVILLWNKYKNKNTPQAILSIAFEAGFNSKTTFNQYFKKSTGLTPSEYLKNGVKNVTTASGNVRFKDDNNLETFLTS